MRRQQKQKGHSIGSPLKEWKIFVEPFAFKEKAVHFITHPNAGAAQMPL